MAKEPEVIQQELEETRSALADKLGQLGEKISGTVENVTEAVEDTVESVTETVESVSETAQETVHAVQHALDIPSHVRKYPWLWFGGSILLGFVGGKFLLPRKSRKDYEFEEFSTHPQPYGYSGRQAEEFFGEPAGTYTDGRHNGFHAETEPTPAEEEQPGGITSWLGSMAQQLSPELNRVKELALGTMFGVARDMISKSLPESLKNEVINVFDNITETAGGKPIQGTVMDDSSEPSESRKGVNREEFDRAEMERPMGSA